MLYHNYHKHTMYSNIMTPDCIISVEDIAKRAVELGHTSITTTEHGYAGNIFEYYDTAMKYGLKFVFGVEYYYVNDRFEKDRSNSHLMVLAKNQRGMKQMMRIMSEANKTGFYGKPRIDKELLFSLNPKDVVVTSTCVISYISKFNDYEENFIQPLHNYFGDNFYLEIHDNTHSMQVAYNEIILELHNKYKIPLIHACDTHYIYPEDDKNRTEFLNGKNIYYPEEEGFILDYPTSDQIFERYEQQGVFTRKQVEDSLVNTGIIDGFEIITLDKTTIKMPSIYPDLTHKEKIKVLKDIINTEWKHDRNDIAKSKHREYLDAIRFETQIIEDTMMEDYFLLNYEIIRKAKAKGGILTSTGRGSAPSFYTNKLFGFTEIDRLEAPITLYPTRFISTSRILETKSLPDIDFNTADPKPFYQSAKEILGEDHIYPMVAYGTMQESEAFRNYCRAKNIPMDEFNQVGKDLDSYRNHAKWKDIIEGSKKFIGVIDSVSPHPCAYLLLDKPISEEIGLLKVGDEFVCLIDSDTSDAWKYLKNDFLTVKVWKIISEGFKAIGKPIPNIRELTRLVENDEKVWELYEKGLTATLNQAGTESGTPQAMQYKPRSVRELSAWVSAIRPQFASMKHIFLNREGFSYNIPEFDAILKESENFILFQENIMATLVFASFPEDQTYGLLKAISKKKEGIIEPIYEKFINGFIQKTGSKEKAEKVWRIIEDAVGYGFNSSHAYAVALDSIYGAYLKANNPLEYYSVVLGIYEDDTEMTAKIYSELPHFGITVDSIKFGKSKAHYSYDKDNNTIFKGLKSIKYLNEKVAEELYTLALNVECPDFVDALVEIRENTSCDARQLSILIKLNYFNMYGKNKKLFDIFTKFEKRFKKTHKDKTKVQRIAEIKEYAETLKDEALEVYEQLMFEKEYYGYITTTIPRMDESYHIILDIDKKYTPKLTLYRFNDGQTSVMKVDKKKFYDNADMDTLYVGDVIRIMDIVYRQKSRKVDGKWIKIEETEAFLDRAKIIQRIKNNPLHLSKHNIK